MKENDSIFGDAIYSYSRAQAIEDGVLVDLSQFKITRDHWKLQLCCTDAVWSIMEQAVREHGKDYAGMIHDLSTMAKLQIGRKDVRDTLYFQCIIGIKTNSLKIHCGPGDTPYPVLTLMLQSES